MKFLHHPILRFFKRAKDINIKRERGMEKRKEKHVHAMKKKKNTSRNMATLETLASMQEQNT
jgi:hypothetical protein